MADALSQREIEALMTSAGVGDGMIGAPLSRQNIKAYDFRRPDKFAKEHLRALRNLNEVYSRLLASSLASYLRTTVQVRLAEFEQTPYGDYIAALPTPTLLYVLGMSPLPGQALLQMDLPTGRVILERLLGGAGGPSSRTGDLTEIELALLRTLGGSLVAPMTESWASVYPVEFTYKEPTLSPEFVQVALSSETTMVFFFEITMFNMTGSLSLCIPHPVIQPALEDLAAQLWSNVGSANPAAESDRLNPSEQLIPVQLPVTAELGRAEMTTRELVNLAPGQVIKLGTPATGPVVVRVAGHAKFTGRPGIAGKNLAVQITKALG